MKNAWRSLGAGALIILLTVVAYLPALRGGFVWDDDVLVTGNQALQSLEGLKRIWFKLGTTIQYCPLTFTSFWVEYHLWQLWPSDDHRVNVLLHAFSAALVWRAH